MSDGGAFGAMAIAVYFGMGFYLINDANDRGYFDELPYWGKVIARIVLFVGWFPITALLFIGWAFVWILEVFFRPD